jgi:osmotically-inducible protein OsmY
MLIIAIAALAAIGCNSEDANKVSQDARELAGSAGKAIGGMTLAAKVNMALGLHKNVDMTGLHIEAKDGVVKVGGHVDTAKEKETVLQVVNGTKGVDKVVDELRIKK